jgi:hypothetical protein
MASQPPGELVADEVLVRELAGWLDGIPPAAGERVAAWSDATWERFRQHIVMQGLGAVLARHARAPGVDAMLPSSLRDWLEEQERRNGLRVDRMQGELAAILREAAARGVDVIPLKGAYLFAVDAVDPRRRPVADLDVLIRPADRRSFRAVLRSLGYHPDRRVRVRVRPQPWYGPGGRTVVARDGEHPDNPRPIEVHVAVHRHSWEWLDDDALTSVAWATARPGTLLGEPALLPPIELVFEHLAVHATIGLMRGRARLIQWLDLALLARAGAAPTRWHLPHLAYPALELAARAIPDLREHVDIVGLARANAPAAVSWARTVPPNRYAGLESKRPVFPPRGRGGTLERWRPSRLRLGVAYGPVPLGLALRQHALAAGRYAIRFAGSRARYRVRRWKRRLRRNVRRARRRAA